MSFFARTTCARVSRHSSRNAIPPSPGPNRGTRIVAAALRSKRFIFLLVAAAAVLVMLVAAVPALADTFSPESGGAPDAGKKDTPFKNTGAPRPVLFVPGGALIIFSVVKIRRR